MRSSTKPGLYRAVRLWEKQTCCDRRTQPGLPEDCGGWAVLCGLSQRLHLIHFSLDSSWTPWVTAPQHHPGRSPHRSFLVPHGASPHLTPPSPIPPFSSPLTCPSGWGWDNREDPNSVLGEGVPVGPSGQHTCSVKHVHNKLLWTGRRGGPSHRNRSLCISPAVFVTHAWGGFRVFFQTSSHLGGAEQGEGMPRRQLPCSTGSMQPIDGGFSRTVLLLGVSTPPIARPCPALRCLPPSSPPASLVHSHSSR